jgi:hypothetical protein
MMNYVSYLIHSLLGRRILDVGFGSGRDMSYFTEQGYNPIRIDITDGFIKSFHTMSSISIAQMDMRLLAFVDKSFNGMW